MLKSSICWIIAFVLALLSLVLILLFGSDYYKQGVYDIGHEFKTKFCTDDQYKRKPHVCGDLGQCWAWCHDENELAKSLWESRGKWCYTSGDNIFSGIGKMCGLDHECYAKTKCYSKCSPGCWKSSDQEKYISSLQDRAQKDSKKPRRSQRATLSRKSKRSKYEDEESELDL